MQPAFDQLDDAADFYRREVDALGERGWRQPSLCAGWDAAQVVVHVTIGDRRVRALALDAMGTDRTLLAELPSTPEERMQRDAAMAAWEPGRLRDAALTESAQMREAARELHRKMPNAVLHLPFGESPLPTVLRIRTTEYVIHGHDLEPASGKSQPLPAWFIDASLPWAALNMTRPHARSSPHRGKSASFHLHRTDGEGEWVLRAEAGEARSSEGHDRADVAFRGPGEGLYWVLMGRAEPAECGVEVHGDPALAAAFKEWFPGP